MPIKLFEGEQNVSACISLASNICCMFMGPDEKPFQASLFLLELHGPYSPNHINNAIEEVDKWSKNPNGIIKENILNVAVRLG